MMILYVQLRKDILKLYKSYFRKLMTRVIFIKVNMKVGIVYLVKHFGLKANYLKEIYVQIVNVNVNG